MTLGHAGESVADRYRLDRQVDCTPDVEHWEAYDKRLARSVAVRLEREPETVEEAGGAPGDKAAPEEAGRGSAGAESAATESAAAERDGADSESAEDGGAEPEDSAAPVLTRIAQLSHPNVAAVYDVGVTGGEGNARVRYAISEWSHGHTLGQLMRSGPQPWPKVADWGRQTSAGLAALHEIGIAHGALGPDSIAVFDDRRVKIMGAGLEQTGFEQAGGGSAVVADTEALADDVRALAELMWKAAAGAAPVWRDAAESGVEGGADAGGGAGAASETRVLPETKGSQKKPDEPAGASAEAATVRLGQAESARAAERRLNTDPLRETGMPPVFIELLVEMLAGDPAACPTAALVEERITPLVPVVRAADTPVSPPPRFTTTQQFTAGSPRSTATEFKTPADMAARNHPTSPIRPAPPGAKSAAGTTAATAATTASTRRKRPRGLMIGLGLLVAAFGSGLGLLIANHGNSSSPAPPPVNVTVTNSAGIINLPSPTVATSSAAPVHTAPRTTAPASSAPSPSQSPSASPSASASASASANPGGSASPSSSATATGTPNSGSGGGGSGSTPSSGTSP
jgi:hypothetical protein